MHCSLSVAPEIVRLPLKEDVKLMLGEMTSSENRHFTRETVGHEPTHNELALQWIERGGLEHHRQEYEIAA